MNSKILSQENPIIELIENEPRISHKIIAKLSGIKEKSILDLITKNSSDFEEFGQLRFKIATVTNSVGAVNKQKTYFSNEAQSTLLMTYLRNTEQVKKFKKELVKEFFKMRELLQISKPTKNENLISVSTENMRKELEALKFVLDNFNLSEKEKIEKSNEVFQNLNFIVKLENPHLKKHEQVFTLTDLLKEFQIPMQTSKFNIKLQSFRIIEYSENGWEILEMKFGENRKYQERNNPKYYKSTFQELLDIVLELGKGEK